MDQTNIHIRTATLEDVASITRIYNEALAVSPYVQDNHPHTVEKRSTWFNQKQTEGLPIYVAEEDGNTTIGFANLNTFLTTEYSTTVHISVYVDESARGLGIGKLLIRQLINWSKENHKHTILAGIDAENIASIKLHESFGFEKVADFKQVIKKFDSYRDLHFYQLMLD